MKILSITLILVLLVSSCSNWQKANVNFEADSWRTPANIPVTFDDVMSTKKSGKKSKVDLKKQVYEYVKNAMVPNNAFTAEIVPSSSLPSDVAFKLELDVVNGKYIYRVLHSADAFTDHEAIAEFVNFSNNVSHGNRFITHFSDFEMYYNARENDLEALKNFMKLRLTENYDPLSVQWDIPFTDLLKKRAKETQEQMKLLDPLIKKQAKERKDYEAKRKSVMDSLDKAADDKQFKTYIQKNDREGAVAILKKYLPYEDMAPFERRFWDQYLEVIRNPVPLHQRVFVYRGINDDMIHTAIIDGVELDKDDAIKESKAFVMSTVMTKNQGSWNRRLRSLEAMNEKVIGTVGGESEFARSARITTIFKNHSNDPMGSPYLSFTPDLNIATSFGTTRNSAYLIDPRAIHFNFTSGFENEKEFLATLMTFPDEMVALWDQNYHSGTPVSKFFKDKLVERIQAEYGKNEAAAIIKEIEQNTFDFFSPEYKVGSAPAKSGFMGTVGDFFKKFKKKPETPMPDLSKSGAYNCNHLIKSFWTTK